MLRRRVGRFSTAVVLKVLLNPTSVASTTTESAVTVTSSVMPPRARVTFSSLVPPSVPYRIERGGSGVSVPLL